jgi:hypothetical protein
MNYELIYDAVTTSEAPRSALTFALGLSVAAGAWGFWLKRGGHPLHGGVKFVGVAAILMFLITGLYKVEQYTITRRTDVQSIEGALMGFWTKEERVRNADGGYSKVVWEGFWINGVPFVYRRNLDQNYFHGSRDVELKDGMVLRLRYVNEAEIGNQIVRIERLVVP